MRVALVHDVFFGEEVDARLLAVLLRARELGAEVAVLPELPLNAWAPYSKVARDEDAEPENGPRQQLMDEVAASSGVALVGGAIVRDAPTGTRYNTAVVYGATGGCLARYRKIHLPEEEGYWETSHYAPGDRAPELVPGLSMRAGIQICSDVNRPQGFQLLAARGAEVVFVPRATPPATWERWRTVLRANAVTSGAYVVSVNRPRPENGASIGGPSIAIAPTGEVMVETIDQLTVVDLSSAAVSDAAGAYPGYLERFPALYADAWRRIAEG